MKKLFFVVLFFVILLGLWLVRENIFPHNDSLSDMEVQQYIEAGNSNSGFINPNQ